MQSGLFFHATSGDADVYRYQVELEIQGPLDAALLRRCADALLERHTALRTGYLAEETDEPVGVVLDGVSVPWQEVDLTDVPEPASRLRGLAVGERTRPLPLDDPPLLRMLLVRVAPGRSVLVLTVHHIVLDGWSMPVLLRELFALYAAGGDGTALRAARPFRDYLAWLAAKEEQDPLARWRTSLEGLSGPTLIGTPGSPADLPVRLPVELDRELSGRLTRMAREQGVTLNTVLSVLWGLLLSSVAGRTDIVFGSTVTGRPSDLPGAADMVGLFINTVPLRVRLDPGETVAQLLRRVQDEQVALLDSHHVGLGRLQREAGFAPLFDTLFVLESYPGGELGELLAGTGLTVVPRSGQDATHYPLVLVAVPGDPMTLLLKYQPAAIPRERVEQLANRLPELAAELTEHPDRLVVALASRADAEARLVESWNDTEAPTTDATLVDLVEQWADRTPDAPAVRWSGGELTYRDLDEQANALAHRLIEQGVGAETPVGLYLSRSPDLVIAMLAVGKAGGAFVPLDPDWPALRTQSVVANAQITTICTPAPSPDGTNVALGTLNVPKATFVPVDRGGVGVGGRPERWGDGEQVAYVIYTSGSTGTPKGAMIRHRSIANRMVWQQGLLGFGPGDVALFKAPLGFDISINEIFLPLTTGAVLAIAEPGAERDVQSLVRLIARERVSFCYLVSSMLAAMLELPEFTGSSGSLRHVWCGGELLTPELFARFRASVDATMYHGYGPAEATIGVTHEIYRADGLRDGATIGRPNPNTRVQVLDEFLRPVPIGVVGELYVGGLLLGRGYVGDPVRTADRFVADPFGAAGERLYRTGDLACWLPDGRLRFAGRGDNQVKIRGMRVELEEIESVLAGHPDLTQAVVLAPLDDTGTARLVGFYAARDGAVSPAVLRSWLKARLAEHMVPAELVELPSLPIQPSGKVDRAELAKAVPQPSTESVAPGTATEKRLLELFRTVLAREDLGVTDDFFAFGGHSLLATRLVVAIRSEFEQPFAVRSLLEQPTVAELAVLLDSGQDLARPASGVLFPLRRDGSGPPLFCVHPVSGLAQAYSGLLGELPDRPIYGLQARSLVTDTGLPVDLEDMAEQYVREIREVAPAGPYHLLGWSLGGTVAHLMACLLVEAGERVETLALLDSIPGRLLGSVDESWSLERGLAQLLRVSGYPVDADQLDPGRALETIAGDGSLGAFTSDDLCNVALSWRHSAGLTARTNPVYPGELELFQAERDADGRDLAQAWKPQVSGPIQVHHVDATHWDMALPGPLAQVAARLLARPAKGGA